MDEAKAHIQSELSSPPTIKCRTLQSTERFDFVQLLGDVMSIFIRGPDMHSYESSSSLDRCGISMRK